MSGDDISTTNEYARLLKQMIMIKIMRPDRMLSSIAKFVSKTLGEESLNISQVDLLNFVGEGISPKNPLMLVSAPGFDASYKVEHLAKQVNKKFTSVAIGSPESYAIADTAIRNAAKSGNWVLLKNVHLAPQWLVELEKTIYNMALDKNFRLFLTME
jgi:dynein heavy chain 1